MGEIKIVANTFECVESEIELSKLDNEKLPSNMVVERFIDCSRGRQEAVPLFYSSLEWRVTALQYTAC